MGIKTIDFYGEEANVIASVLEQRDNRIKGLQQELAERDEQIVELQEALEYMTREFCDLTLEGE